MPYLVAADQTISDAAAATIDIAIPNPHQADDLILLFVTQDGGGTDITCSGFTLAGGSQAQAQAQRTVCLYKFAASSSEADITISGATEDWIVSAQIWRAVDTTTPIDAYDKTDSANSTTAYLDSGTVTPTNNNCAILQCWGFDGATAVIEPEAPASIMCTTKGLNTLGCVQYTGYYNQDTAGLTTAIRMLSEVATEGGTCLTVALKDANPSSPQMSPDCIGNYDIIRRYGNVNGVVAGTPGFARHESTTWQAQTAIAAATIDGLTVSTTASSFEEFAGGSTTIATQSPWGRFSYCRQRTSGVDATGRWLGMGHAITSVDLTGKVIAIEWGFATNLVNSFFGSKGAIIYLQDGSGGWAAWQLRGRQGTQQPNIYINSISIDATPLDSSGTFDKTDVVRVAYLWHKVGTATTDAGMRVKNLLALSPAVFIGGSSPSPSNPAFIDRAINGNGGQNLANVQGLGQALFRAGLQIGNGSRPTYYAASGTSHELPVVSNTTAALAALNDGLGITIDASASDTISFSAGLVATQTRQKFVIDAGSSNLATYDFTGCSIIGYDITNNVSGIIINRATLSSCGITLNGGGLEGCNIIAQPSALLTNAPEGIEDCVFTSAGSGHAIEITATGTFDFEGNAFTGYGADASTDAAVYNNSGGLVTLTIPAGDQLPTVRNGTGASTVLSSPVAAQSVTITNGVAGTRIQVYDLTSSTELYNDIPSSYPYTWTDPSPYVADREIRIRAAYQSGTSAKVFVDTVIGTATNVIPALSFRLNQEDDEVYNTNAIDGSTITTVTIDDSALLVEVDTGTISWPQIYAYETYWLFTEVGIRDEGRFILAKDTANYALFDFKIKNVSAPSVPLVITGGYGVDGDTGASIDILDATGGTIFMAPEHVVPFDSGGAGGATAAEVWGYVSRTLTTPTVSDIADAVIAAEVDGTVTLAESLRLSNAVLGGKVSGAGTGTEVFRDLADTKARITATVDDDGNRTAITRDLT